ncbi:prenyltransferase, partial [Pseudomonas ogarae]
LLGSATLLVGCILGYNLLHHKHPHSVRLLFACRLSLFSPSAATPARPPGPLCLCATLLALSTSTLTYLPRQEPRNHLLRRLPLLLMLSPLALAIYG